MSDDLYNNLFQAISARASATEDFTEAALLAMVAEALEEDGSIAEFVPCHFKQRGMRIDGYGFNDDEATADLFLVEFFGEAGKALTKTALEQAIRRAQVFYERADSSNFSAEIDVFHPVWGLAKQLSEKSPAIRRVRVHLITDAVLSSGAREIPAEQIGTREWTFRVWDLHSISRLQSSDAQSDIEIDFEALFGSPLKCLPAAETQNVSSYLAVIPAEWLARIYGTFSGRLLEQNVRTFLQVKGSVNKGIRRTILDEPEMFFAYNNGISATAAAADISFKGGACVIRSVRHLQIVNGGQTTASIFNVAKRESGKNLEKVSVQMKLTVVQPDLVDSVVPRISEYANSQNKVSAADFFSNHPFHIRVEGISRRVWAPAIGPSQTQTHWFYERARGQYANSTAYLKPSQKKEFDLQNPRKQLIAKTDLAKVEITFRHMPHVVSGGAQKNFARFAEWVSERWGDGGVEFGDAWFQQAVSKLILFRTLERQVQEAPWYAQGYRANTVTYALALLSHGLSNAGLSLDLGKIWRSQRADDALMNYLTSLSANIQQRLIAGAAEGGIANVTEWAKREKCWEDMKAHLTLPDFESIRESLETGEEVSSVKRSARKEQRMMNDIEAQTYVLKVGASYWQSILTWDSAALILAPSEVELLKIAVQMPRKLPHPFQCQKLLTVETRAKKEGFRSPRP